MNTRRRLAFVVCLAVGLVGGALSLSGCITGAEHDPPGDSDGTGLAGEALRALDTEEASFLRQLNAYRAQNGLGALAATPLLNQVAYDHSLAMGSNDFFSHTSQDGRSPFDRMMQAGYAGGYMAENIAAGNSLAAATFEQWRTSPGHNTNMLGPNYRAIGIGRAIVAGSTYGVYWTTDFGDVVDASVANSADAGVTRDGGASSAPDAGAAPDGGAGAAPDAGWQRDGGVRPADDGGVAGPTDGGAPPACVGRAEIEPNNTSGAANSLSTANCGRLDTASDADWFTFTLALRAGYDLRLSSSGDARLAAWQRVGTRYYAVSQASLTHIAKTSSAGGKYLVRVWSPSGRAQSYALTLSR